MNDSRMRVRGEKFTNPEIELFKQDNTPFNSVRV